MPPGCGAPSSRSARSASRPRSPRRRARPAIQRASPRPRRRAARWSGTGVDPTLRSSAVEPATPARRASHGTRRALPRTVPTRAPFRARSRRPGSRSGAHLGIERPQRHPPAEPCRQPVIIAGLRTVRQRDIDASVAAQSCRREQQLRDPSRREPEPGLDVIDRKPTITLKAVARQCHRAKLLALQRLDGVAPQLQRPHGRRR